MRTIADYLIERLAKINLKHVFGVPGDYVLGFYDKLSKNDKIEMVESTDEAHAGFSADAYARVNGIGCVCVTYCVGGFKICNAVACAYAERSPVVVISGSPGVEERRETPLMHHMVRSFECQKEVFEKITCASVVLDNPSTAAYEIDRVLELLQRYKQPVYIELPRDIADKPASYDLKLGTPRRPQSDAENLNEAIEEISSWIESAKDPIIMAGIEISRFNKGKDLVKFAERNHIPVATTFLSKSVISERHPLFMGIYSGRATEKELRERIENSDCLIMLGVMLNDFTLSFMPSKFKKRRTISCSIGDGLKVKNHSFDDVLFEDFTNGLLALDVQTRSSKKLKYKSTKTQVEFEPKKDTPITTARLIEKIDSILDEKMAIVSDVGDSLFSSISLKVHHSNQFISDAFYTSMGFAIPAALGVQKALPDTRPIVMVGDGAFQMTVSEISTMIDHKLNPIIFIFNNNGYTTERFLLDGPFNDIRPWNYEKVTELFGGGKGFVVKTEEDLEEAVSEAIASKEVCILNISLKSTDVSPALKRLTDTLAKRV